jgi:hypothetical protein
MSVPTLIELQSEFATAITRRDAPDAPPHIFLGEAAHVASLIGIYRGNAHASWSKALEGAYPVIRQLVGEEFFGGLVREYGRAEPSASGDLNVFGDLFAEFLARFAHTQNLPYLPDVARLEWAVHRAFYAADAPKLDLALLAALREDHLGALCLRLAPACAVVRSGFPVADIWRVHQPDFQGEVTVDLDAGAQTAFVHRPGYRVEVSALDGAAGAFLALCEKGRPLAAALDAALAIAADFDLQELLLRWIQAGAIAGIESL